MQGRIVGWLVGWFVRVFAKQKLGRGAVVVEVLIE